MDIRDWREFKQRGPVLLRVIFDDAALTMMSKIKCTLKVADNESKNVHFPDSPIVNNLSPNYIRTAFTFQKIDPSKDGWGDITIDVEVKEP